MPSRSLLVLFVVASASAVHLQRAFPDPKPGENFPDLVGLAQVIENGLEPHQRKYLNDLAVAEGRQPKKSNLLRVGRSTAKDVWHAFESAMEKALDDPKLRLNAVLGPARNDSSIFVAISSYRDKSCKASVRNAFSAADRPELVNVGVVQQNCESEHACMTGTGWANTRAWVRQSGADPDCISEFCQSSEGRPHCEAGRVRIVRLQEHLALGPFFARYLNSKLSRGENFFMQIDAHTKFRTGWDTTMIEMMKRTPSYPNSVISTYPTDGIAENTRAWERAPSDSIGGMNTGLCQASFERAGADRYTLRMGRTDIEGSPKGVPRYSAYIAAGFFFTHGSSVERVPLDPFLPYIFMGEEIAVSEKFWTAGFDIYAPTTDVVGHEYVRKNGPKFWESVNMVFNEPDMHNTLTNLVIQRVQNLVGFPEARRADQLSDPTVLARMSSFGDKPVRSREDFLEMTGLDLVSRATAEPGWCRRGETPPHALAGKGVHEL